MIQGQNIFSTKNVFITSKKFLVRASMSKFLQERFPGAFVQDKREISILKVVKRKCTIVLYPSQIQKFRYTLKIYYIQYFISKAVFMG